MIKILLLEDDPVLGGAISDFLKNNNYDVEWFMDAESVLFFGYDLFLVDWMLKEKSGIDFINNLRRLGVDSPIIMMTVKASIDDKLKGFESGVDDYITKPFEPMELLARIKAVLSRYYGNNSIKVNENIILDSNSRVVIKDSKEIKLTHKEFMLFEILLRNRPKVLSYDYLIDYVWSNEGSYETLKSHIYSLRKKLGRELIRSVKGAGYKIDD
jgi:DNA-binding response OmpR family regulator